MTAWRLPLDTDRVTSPYGARAPFATSTGTATSFHQGVDFGDSAGANVHAIGDGTVTKVANLPTSRGLYVVVSHGDGISSLYQHLSAQLVTVGQTVSAGDVLGLVGSSGSATGPHLHLETFTTATGARFDPLPYLADRMSAPQPPAAPDVQPPAADVVATPPSAPAGALGSRVLAFGAQGEDVRELQRILNAWYPARAGFPALVEDGDFGDKTARRVVYLEQRAGLDVDAGIAGAQVFAALHVS